MVVNQANLILSHPDSAIRPLEWRKEDEGRRRGIAENGEIGAAPSTLFLSSFLPSSFHVRLQICAIIMEEYGTNLLVVVVGKERTRTEAALMRAVVQSVGQEIFAKGAERQEKSFGIATDIFPAPPTI